MGSLNTNSALSFISSPRTDSKHCLLGTGASPGEATYWGTLCTCLSTPAWPGWHSAAPARTAEAVGGRPDAARAPAQLRTPCAAAAGRLPPGLWWRAPQGPPAGGRRRGPPARPGPRPPRTAPASEGPKHPRTAEKAARKRLRDAVSQVSQGDGWEDRSGGYESLAGKGFSGWNGCSLMWLPWASKPQQEARPARPEERVAHGREALALS